MNITDIILDKRYGRELSDEQIRFWIDGVTDNSIPDYQVSALLMAIVLNGMNEREMTTLTMCMARSGGMIDLSFLGGIPVDKHSTGGVGDKVTPLIMPLCATFGVETVKLSGRGLGFTGGTVDKFESIEGFEVQIEADRFAELVGKTGMVISGQTPDLAPADKRLYALRDVTGTVDSVPLIASSIMSKKIAGGAKGIVLDVTCGSGAFMKTRERAEELARAMIKIGNLAGIRVVAVVTDMDKPLGKTCGNVLEMEEVFETLSGKGSPDVVEVVSAIASEMIILAGKDGGLTHSELLKECALRLTDGRALGKYYELLLSQGAKVNEDGSIVYKDTPFEEMKVTAPCDGYVSAMKTDLIGHASVTVGAGRLVKTDAIDYGAGIRFYKKTGDKVRRGDTICSIYRGSKATLSDDKLFDAVEMLTDAYSFAAEAPEQPPAVIDIIR